MPLIRTVSANEILKSRARKKVVKPVLVAPQNASPQNAAPQIVAHLTPQQFLQAAKMKRAKNATKPETPHNATTEKLPQTTIINRSSTRSSSRAKAVVIAAKNADVATETTPKIAATRSANQSARKISGATSSKIAPEKAAPRKLSTKTSKPEISQPKNSSPQSITPKTFNRKKAVPQSAVPQSAVPQSAVPQSAVPQSAVAQSAVAQSAVAQSAQVSELKTAPQLPLEHTATSAATSAASAASVVKTTSGVKAKRPRVPKDFAQIYGENIKERKAETPAKERRARKTAQQREKLRALITPDEAILRRISQMQTAVPTVQVAKRRSKNWQSRCGKCGVVTTFSTNASLCSRCGAIAVRVLD